MELSVPSPPAARAPYRRLPGPARTPAQRTHFTRRRGPVRTRSVGKPHRAVQAGIHLHVHVHCHIHPYLQYQRDHQLQQPWPGGDHHSGAGSECASGIVPGTRRRAATASASSASLQHGAAGYSGDILSCGGEERGGIRHYLPDARTPTTAGRRVRGDRAAGTDGGAGGEAEPEPEAVGDAAVARGAEEGGRGPWGGGWRKHERGCCRCRQDCCTPGSRSDLGRGLGGAEGRDCGRCGWQRGYGDGFCAEGCEGKRVGPWR